MSATQVMKQLKSLGSEQTRRIYERHGMTGPMFGVKYGDLTKLAKQYKGEHGLALALWEEDNLDARVLATMIVDPERMTMKSLTAWLRDADSRGLCAALSNVVQRSPVALKLAQKWIAAKKEWTATTGWYVIAGLARENPDAITKAEYRALLKTIETGIHEAKNRVRYAMNSALISIGGYALEKEALAAAKRIGVVEVDHGETGCKTPLATDQIRKTAEKERTKAAKRKAKAKS